MRLSSCETSGSRPTNGSDERADDDELLPHAVAVAGDGARERVRELEAARVLLDARLAVADGDLEDVGDEREVLQARHEVVDVGVVGHVGAEALRRDGVGGDVDARHADAAAVDGLHAHDRADERGLARAVMADEAVDVAGFDGKGEVAHGDGVTVALLEMGDAEDRCVGRGVHGKSYLSIWGMARRRSPRRSRRLRSRDARPTEASARRASVVSLVVPAVRRVAAIPLRQAAGALERIAQDPLHLAVRAAHLVICPALDSLPDSGIDAEWILFARHTINYLHIERSGYLRFESG